MNERLFKLAEQCRGNTMTSEFEPLFNKQKFAELIVRECMACSTWVGKMNTNSVEPVHTAHAVNQRIKQQLGIEL